MTNLSSAERDALLKVFNKSLFANDLDTLYSAATPDFAWRLAVGPGSPTPRTIRTRDALAAYLVERAKTYENLHYGDVATYHAPEATFNSFHLTGRLLATGELVDVLGLERYLFRDGKVMQKDAYWKPAETV